jgi:hypothetical protein
VKPADIIVIVGATLFVIAENVIHLICQRYLPQMLWKWLGAKIACMSAKNWIRVITALVDMLSPTTFAATEKGRIKMKIKNGKIAEATEAELFKCYLSRGYDDIMPFTEYKRQCVKYGTKIVDEDGEDDGRKHI